MFRSGLGDFEGKVAHIDHVLGYAVDLVSEDKGVFFRRVGNIFVEGMRTFYLLNIDWKSGATAHPATLRIGGSEFTLDVPTYTLATIRSARGIAAMVSGNTSDVLSIENRNGELWVTCQTTGPDTITIFSSITGRQTAIPIASAGITAIAFDPDKQ